MSNSFPEQCGSFQSVSTGLPSQFQSDRDELLSPALSQVHDRLEQLALDPNGFEKLDFVFDIADPSAARAMLSDWGNGIFPNMPAIQVVTDSVLSGSGGAYAGQTGTIYLAESTAQDPLLGVRVLAEEVGHHLDVLLNPGGDTSGDEGELFSKVLFGDEISNVELTRLRAEDDHGFINIDGTEIAVEFDNTTGTAYNVGTLSGTQNFSDFVGSSDTNDYYRFYVANTSNFSLSLTGLSADAEVALLNSSGSTIVSSTNGGSRDESISRQLNAGTYYARVYPFGSANTNYNLSLTATPLSTPPTISPSALRATSSNLAALVSGSLNGRYIEADGAYLYQCVDLVKDMTDTERITTSNWRRGENVIQNRSVAQGSSIAIFDSAGRYNSRHTAIFDRYDTVNNSFGFWAWSQNFPTGSGVRRHFIPVNGSSSGNNDADEYHVILPL